MKNKIQLNKERLGLMLKHDIGKYWKKVGIIIGGSFVAVTLLTLLFCLTEDYHFIANEGHTAFFPMILIWVGGLLVSFSFRDLNEEPERIFYLGIPASHLEKYMSRFILTAIVLPVVISIFYCIYAFLYDSFIIAAIDSGITRFSFFSHIFMGTPTSFDYFKMFFLIHAITFLGAITFRKIAIIKTLLIGFATVVTFALLTALATKIVLPELFTDWAILDDPQVAPNQWFQNLVEDYGKDVLFGFIFMVIPIVFWVTGYFKLTEKEA